VIQYQGETHAPSRIIRTVLAVVILLYSFILLGAEAFVAIKTTTAPDLAVNEVIFHGVVIIAAVLMFDPKTGKALADAVLAKLPGGK
jgi:hypothetical protein